MALKILGVAILLGILGIGALFAYFRKDLDTIRPGELAKRVQTTVTKYYDRNGTLLWEDKGDGNYKLVVKADEISDVMKKATIAIEDKDFYNHGGISLSGTLRAVMNNVTGGSTQGGSTLTQQLVKQVFFADQAGDRGISGIPRKIKEAILAIEVERMYSKDDILNLYLNESPYGGRRNGVESAAQTYFGKHAKDLTLPEASLLAAIPNNPSVYDPYNVAGHDALIERQHKVLDEMVSLGYTSKANADAAKKFPILDSVKPLSDQYKDIKAPHFVQLVRSQLEQELGKA
ncbi:MAG TPA: transglycosylase domain-containing protein, partial [Candidatus Saccharimonadales bacterium]